jgi:drug/metabolite transporter (DMT)-like permease
MLWLLFVFLTILTWGSYNVLLKLAEPHISQSWALFLIGAVQVVVGAFFIWYQRSTDEALLTVKGATIAVIAGLVFAMGMIFFLYAFKFKAPASVAIALYTIGALLIGMISGPLVFHEVLSPRILTGIGFALVSIALLTLK